MMKVNDLREAGIRTIDRDICVIAGAGSGKTRMLVDRFLYLVSEEVIPLHRILAITFTEKAAQEMRERISAFLEAQNPRAGGMELHAANISTIHGFCARLLREYAVEAELDPRFSVMDELQAESVQLEILDEVLHEFRRARPEDVAEIASKVAWSQGYNAEESFGFREALLESYNEIRTAGQSEFFAGKTINTGAPYEWKVLADSLDRIMGELEALRRDDSMTEKTLEKIDGVLTQWSLAPQTDGNSDLEARIGALEKVLNAVNLNVSKRAKIPLQELRGTLEREIPFLVEKSLERAKIILTGILIQFHEKYAETKFENSRVDFLDLEEKAFRLISGDRLTGDGVRNKFDFILVDEFQDTNLLQKKIIDSLRKGGDLFAVGDPQQSIYGFRHARVEIFYGYRDEVERNNGCLVPLRASYRSRPEILAFVNRVFREAVEKKGDTLNIDFSPLSPAADFETKPIPSVEILFANIRGKNSRYQLEAEMAAERICRLVNEENVRISKKHGADGVGRKIGYGDIGILFRATGRIRIYEEALAKFGIPYTTFSGRGFYDSQEIVDILHFLTILDNPLYELSSAVVLRSPFTGISDETLFWIFHHARSRSSRERIIRIGEILPEIREVSALPQNEREKVMRFVEISRALRSFARRHSIAETIEEMMSVTGYDELLLREDDGKLRYARINRVISLARSFERTGGGLADFIAFFYDQRLRNAREASPSPEMKGGEEVSLMTVHAAKGLEFPVVVLADSNYAPKNTVPDIIFRNGAGITCRREGVPGERPAEPESYREARAEIKMRNDEEAYRLFYVAMTRAEEHLIIAGSAGVREKDGVTRDYFGWMKMLKEWIPLEELPVDEPVSHEFTEDGFAVRLLRKGNGTGAMERREEIIPLHDGGKGVKTEDEPDRPSQAAGPESVLKEAREILAWAEEPLPMNEEGDYVYSVTDVLNAEICPGRYFLRGRYRLPSGVSRGQGGGIDSGEDVRDAERRNVDDDIPYDEIGNAVHQVLSMYHPGGTDLSGLVSRALLDFNLPGRCADTTMKLAEKFHKGPRGRQAMAAQRALRETFLVFQYRGYTFRGKADLIYFTPDAGYVLVDYKTSPAKPDEISRKAKSYELQLQLYAYGLKKIFKRTPQEAVLAFLEPDVEVIVGTGEKEIRGALEKVDRFLAMVKSGSYEFRRSGQCRWCEYNSYCDQVRPLR